MLRDVRNELVSVEAARAGYGVIVDTEAWRVDIDGTSALREQMRSSRGWEKPPFVSWDDDGTEEALDAAE